MKNIRFFLFDFDGTIADTMYPILDIYNGIVAPAFNCVPIKADDVREMRGKNPRDVMRRYNVTLAKLPLMVLRARKELAKQIDKIRPHEGMPDALQNLKSQGHCLGILTQNSHKNIERFCANHNLGGVFDFICTGKHPFGKHVAIKRILRSRKIKNDEIIYIGDETRDIEAAHKAGIKVAAVTWGYNNREALEKARPDWMIDSAEGLWGINWNE